MLVALTMVSASVDAISYLGLGHVFPANMTGNTVLLGLGLATGDFAAAVRSAVALGAFLLGAAAAGAAVPDHPRWSTVRIALVAELVLLALLCGSWLGFAAAPGSLWRFGLIAVGGAAMGMQSALVRALDVPVTTTYITGTWVALSAGTAALLRPRTEGPRAEAVPARQRGTQALVVVAYLATACAAAAVAHRAGPGVATAIPLGLMALTLAGCPAGRTRTDRR